MKAFYVRLIDETPTATDIYYTPLDGKGFWLRPLPLMEAMKSVQYFNYFDKHITFVQKDITAARDEIQRASDKLDTLRAML